MTIFPVTIHKSKKINKITVVYRKGVRSLILAAKNAIIIDMTP